MPLYGREVSKPTTKPPKKSRRNVPPPGVLNTLQWGHIAIACAVVGAFALELYHGWDYVRVPQFWGEEGKFFYKQAYESGLAALFRTCQGYLHVYPRIIAFVATLLPMGWAPAVTMFGALLGQLLIFAMVCSPRLPLSPLARALFIMAVACSPNRGEILLNLTNVQWYLAPGLVLVLLRGAPRHNNDLLVDLGWLLLLGFTGPYLVLFVPICAAVRALSWAPMPSLERRRWLGAGSIALVHGLMWRLEERQTHRLVEHINTTFQAWAATFANMVLPFAFGSFSPWVQGPVPTVWLLTALAFAAGCALLLFPNRAAMRDPLRWGLLLCGGVCYSAGIWETRDLPQLMHPYGNGERSFFILYLAVAWLLALTVSQAATSPKQRVAAASLLVLSAGCSLASFPAVNARANFNYPLQVRMFEQQGYFTFHQPPNWTYDLQRDDGWNP